MSQTKSSSLTAYLDALAERDGAVAALEFLPNERRTECETLIHELNLKLAQKAAALGKAQREIYKDSLDARRNNVAELIAHLERMRPYVSAVPFVETRFPEGRIGRNQ
jgi:hypothetical protein